jgi:hypothetical protein
MSNNSQIGENPSVKILKKISKQLDLTNSLLGRLPVPPVSTTTTTTTTP